MTKFKKVLALFLALVMCVSMLNLTVFAATVEHIKGSNNVEYGTITYNNDAVGAGHGWGKLTITIWVDGSFACETTFTDWASISDDNVSFVTNEKYLIESVDTDKKSFPEYSKVSSCVIDFWDTIHILTLMAQR